MTTMMMKPTLLLLRSRAGAAAGSCGGGLDVEEEDLCYTILFWVKVKVSKLIFG